MFFIRYNLRNTDYDEAIVDREYWVHIVYLFRFYPNSVL